jgi:hypothetical protein
VRFPVSMQETIEHEQSSFVADPDAQPGHARGPYPRVCC